METQNISVGSLVWAKLKFCPFWPARVVNPPPEVGTGASNQFCVLFFGTKNYGWVRTDNMVDYAANRAKYANKARPRAFFNEAVQHMDEYIRDPIKYASHALVKPINNQITIKKEIVVGIKTEDNIDDKPFTSEKVDCVKEDASVKLRAIETERANIIQELIQVKGENQKLNLLVNDKEREIKKSNGALTIALDRVKSCQTQIDLLTKASNEWKDKYQLSQVQNSKSNREYKTVVAKMKQLQLSMNQTQNSKSSPEQSDSEDYEEYDVDALLDDKVIRGKRKFLVKWKNSWVDEPNLDCKSLLKKYLDSKNSKK